ncbi:subtilisin-like serine protease [Fusarium sp. NRRL 52700]|nr:subtilisin-like serine protease [Fusarium sp. NRRL 52700]
MDVHPPFKPDEAVILGPDAVMPVPGHPTVTLADPDEAALFLKRELSTERLRQLYRLLFLVSRPRNISSLSQQIVKGREICISELPNHHLVWHHKRVFIKPVPKFLLSHAFWAAHLRPNLEAEYQFRLEALGFLRTYSALIQHESDFDLALQLRLIPKTFTWETWCIFIAAFRNMSDKAVSKRYHYGEIRLTRLNFWHSLFLGTSFLEINGHYDRYFAGFGGPMLFTLAAITVILGAMQIGLETDAHYYRTLGRTVVPLVVVATVVSLAFFPLLYIFFLLRELYFFIFHFRKLE